jgi:hypothetical protein
MLELEDVAPATASRRSSSRPRCGPRRRSSASSGPTRRQVHAAKTAFGYLAPWAGRIARRAKIAGAARRDCAVGGYLAQAGGLFAEMTVTTTSLGGYTVSAQALRHHRVYAPPLPRCRRHCRRLSGSSACSPSPAPSSSIRAPAARRAAGRAAPRFIDEVYATRALNRDGPADRRAERGGDLGGPPRVRAGLPERFDGRRPSCASDVDPRLYWRRGLGAG